MSGGAAVCAVTARKGMTMNKIRGLWRKALTLLLGAALLFSTVTGALAASGTAGNGGEPAGYLILGTGLSDSQRETVLRLLGVKDMNDYQVDYTTHEEELARFGDYLSPSLLGSKALSSILLIPAEKGSGITVTTYNINYCTEAMYQSALADAGVEDVNVYVAGPMELSGTCALASAMKAYSIMTGENLDEDAMDAAAQEIVTTGEVADAIGDQDTATKLITAVKEKALSENLNEEQIGQVLDQLCENMGITLDEDTRAKIIETILKLKDVDIDLDKLKEQAGALFDSIQEELKKLDESGVTQESANFFSQMIDAIVNFFRSLFGGLFGSN